MYDSRVAEVGKQGKDVSKNCVRVDIPEHSVAGIYNILWQTGLIYASN